MKTRCTNLVSAGLLVFLVAMPNTALAQQGAMLHTWPDSLILQTYTGTIIMDDSGTRSVYFLDTDGDEAADYHLSFGPWWYVPDSGAERPSDGDMVTVVAAEWDSQIPNTLMVFELDGLVWRDPVEYGRFGWNSLPVWEPSVPLITVTGIVHVDTTYFYHHWYLDTDDDDVVDYQLGFGPPWFEPESGAVRPEEGQEVTVTGRVHYTSGIDMLAVFELDGLLWREARKPSPWAGTWMRKDMIQHAYSHARNDSASWIQFPPGAMTRGSGQHGGGMGSYAWPDSAYVEFWRIHPDSLPGAQYQEQNRYRFTAHYLNMHDPQGNGMMNGRYGSQDGRIQFAQRARLRLHYDDQERERQYLHRSTIRVEAWNRETHQWDIVEGVTVETDENSVSFEPESVYMYYAVSASSAATDVEPGEALPSSFMLGQNFPNPFNPITNIPFTLERSQPITLQVFDALGRWVETVVEGHMPAGSYTIRFDARDLPSGVYMYQIRGGTWVMTRPMTLLR